MKGNLQNTIAPFHTDALVRLGILVKPCHNVLPLALRLPRSVSETVTVLQSARWEQACVADTWSLRMGGARGFDKLGAFRQNSCISVVATREGPFRARKGTALWPSGIFLRQNLRPSSRKDCWPIPARWRVPRALGSPSTGSAF